jgi:peptidoglycan hydrolase-like protein with peptidoglycan-binding domain
MDPESSDGKQQSSEDKSPDALQGNASAADGSVPPPVVTLPSPPAEEPKAAVAEPKPAVAEPKPAVEEPKPALADDAPKSDLKPWPSNKTDQTREIQILLRDLDLYHGTTNGTLGPATRAAIRQFQLTNGDADTGEPTEELFDVLQKKRALMPIDRTQK